MKESKVTIVEQIEILECAKKKIQSNFEIYTCLAIKQAVYTKYMLYTKFDTADYIPLHNRRHANKLCKLNNIEITNTTYRKSQLYGWWFFEKETIDGEDKSDISKMRAVRISYLDALIDELKKML